MLKIKRFDLNVLRENKCLDILCRYIREKRHKQFVKMNKNDYREV